MRCAHPVLAQNDVPPVPQHPAKHRPHPHHRPHAPRQQAHEAQQREQCTRERSSTLRSSPLLVHSHVPPVLQHPAKHVAVQVWGRHHVLLRVRRRLPHQRAERLCEAGGREGAGRGERSRVRRQAARVVTMCPSACAARLPHQRAACFRTFKRPPRRWRAGACEGEAGTPEPAGGCSGPMRCLLHARHARQPTHPAGGLPLPPSCVSQTAQSSLEQKSTPCPTAAPQCLEGAWGRGEGERARPRGRRQWRQQGVHDPHRCRLALRCPPLPLPLH